MCTVLEQFTNEDEYAGYINMGSTDTETCAK